MALAWGLGFFLLGGLLLGLAGAQTRAEVGEAFSTVTTSLLTDLGLEADTLADLTVSDPSGRTVTADDIADVVAASAAASRERVVRQVLLTLPALAVVAGVAGWWLASRAIRPIAAMTAHARRVSSDTLDTRIDLRGPDDELKQLADEFDSMMERLDHAFNAQQQFAASASHELRTPLTVIRTELDVALDVPHPTPDDLADMGDVIRDALDRSERTIDSLLALARSGVAETSSHVDLAQVIEKCLDDTASERAARGITVHRSGSRTAAVRGDPSLLDRMIGNIVQNATLHNIDGGDITIDLTSSSTGVTCTITNTGPVLTSVDRLGEPFYRADNGTGRPGSGLGLVVADSIARAHRGQIHLSPNPGGGLVVHVHLPARTHADAGPHDTTSSTESLSNR
jgi:signal transduction histidine kinase